MANTSPGSPRNYVTGDYGGDVPRFGQHYVTGAVAGTFLAVFVDPFSRFDAAAPLHRWARRYAVVVIVQGAAEIARPWHLYACPAYTIYKI